MKTFIFFLFVVNVAGASIVPERIVLPSLNLYHSKNIEQEDGTMKVRTLVYGKRGDFRRSNKSVDIPREDFDKFLNEANSVYRMIPKDDRSTFPGVSTDEKIFVGTAFHIGNNLVLTNHHVLDRTFQNMDSCGDFELKNQESITFKCQKVHHCNTDIDMCLIEMAPIKKSKRGVKYEISLEQGPSLKLKAEYFPNSIEQDIITTAIGNSAGLGIHYSQGRWVKKIGNALLFWAPSTYGNSGGPLLNQNGEVIGLVKQESMLKIDPDPSKVFNVAAPIEVVIHEIRKALQNDPEILQKFNDAVIE